MSLHSYSRCWLHVIWSTQDRERVLDMKTASQLSAQLSEYAAGKQIYMKVNYVNPDHVHALVDLPTNLTIENLLQLLKGSSSHWINSTGVLPCRFAWGRGYGAFSVSESNVSSVAEYIARQKEHHRVKTFAEELQEFAERHQLRWVNDVSR